MHPDDADPRATLGLAAAVREVERHVAAAGWDAPVRVFALVATAAAIEADPQLAGLLGASVPPDAANRAWHLTSVEQEGLPAADDLEHLLAQLAWPASVDGVALTVERVVLPPGAQDRLPDDAAAAQAAALAHPGREDVRLAVGVLRTGASWCVVRTRSADADDQVLAGATLVPGLVDALASTLR